MGLDYIRAQTGKPWKKRWDRGLDRLKTPTLFDLNMTETARTATVELEPSAKVRPGDVVVVQTHGDSLTISDGLRAVGRIARPAAELIAAVANRGGYATGTLERVGLFGDTAEISLQ